MPSRFIVASIAGASYLPMRWNLSLPCRLDLSSFTSMIIPTVRGREGLENDDNYYNLYPIGNMLLGSTYILDHYVYIKLHCLGTHFLWPINDETTYCKTGEGRGQRIIIGMLIGVNDDNSGWLLSNIAKSELELMQLYILLLANLMRYSMHINGHSSWKPQRNHWRTKNLRIFQKLKNN